MPSFQLLDTLFGFVAILFALSLVVTTLVQILQSTFRLRPKNLEVSLTSLLGTAKLDASLAGAVAKKMVASTTYRGRAHALVSRLFGDTRTEISYEEFTPLLARMVVGDGDDALTPKTSQDALVQWWGKGIERFYARGDAGDENQEGVDPMAAAKSLAAGEGHDDDEVPRVIRRSEFERMERNSSGRFQTTMRGWTAGAALFVAVGFQVDALGLLRDLSTDAELRERTVAIAEEYRESGRATLDELGYRDVADEALQRLVEEFPDHAGLIEQVPGNAPTHRANVRELRLVLQEEEARDEIVTRYEKIVVEIDDEVHGVAKQVSDEARAQLATVNLGFWQGGTAFYTESAQHGIGVIVTWFLLMLGAPFWFEQLRRLGGLRDVLADARKES